MVLLPDPHNAVYLLEQDGLVANLVAFGRHLCAHAASSLSSQTSRMNSSSSRLALLRMDTTSTPWVSRARKRRLRLTLLGTMASRVSSSTRTISMTTTRGVVLHGALRSSTKV